MGVIKNEVETGHLSLFPAERNVLRPFLNGFDVTWAKRRRAYNTELSIYFLLPEHFIQEQFGFDSEIMLVVSDYPDLQPRTMQAAESFLNDDPAKGRVDQAFFFLISKDESSPNWVDAYTMRNPQSRIPVVFVWGVLEDRRSDHWLIRNSISDQLFSRDFFDYQLPLETDLFFFGRDAVVAEFADAIRRSANRGLFGLRKTGKTSVLFKVKRLVERGNDLVFYYDCKNPAIRSQEWRVLLERIIRDIEKSSGKSTQSNSQGMHISDRFKAAIANIPNDRSACLIFDEIEYISPIAKLDPHWHQDFIPFWQTMWTAQSEIRRLSFIIAGVNPSVVEVDSVDGVQNPMFGIVRPTYLRGLEEDELGAMIRYFGKRMGLKFTHDGIAYLYSRYGGHPFLTRMACSYMNRMLTFEKVHRPVVVDIASLKSREVEREEEVAHYSRHVVSELREFYPVEYELLEMIATGNIADAIEFVAEPEYTKHLKDYGLIDVVAGQRPRLRIPVISKFIASETTRRRGMAPGRYKIPREKRSEWIANRLRRIAQEIRLLEQKITDASLPRLYGEGGFPEAERFCEQLPVSDRATFESFVNVCNLCLVEPIQNLGIRNKNPQYYWHDVKSAYPDLWNALHRIKVYRHNNLHLELTPAVEQDVKAYLVQDLDGKRVTQVEEPYFLLQQAIVDELFIALQCELARYE